jgi:hypothetical protein
MKKLIYTLLAVSIVFASCNDEDEIIAPVAPSIVGVWTPTSISVISSFEVVAMGEIINSFDTSYTMTPTDEEWDFPAKIEFTNTGTGITTNQDGEIETDSYTTSGNSLTITNSDDEETNTFTYTVTTTDLVLTQSETETETEDGQTMTSSNNITINCTRQ